MQNPIMLIIVYCTALRNYSIDSVGLTFQESGCIKLRKYIDYRKPSVMPFKLSLKHLRAYFMPCVCNVNGSGGGPIFN
jgi:hypothetical protein